MEKLSGLEQSGISGVANAKEDISVGKSREAHVGRKRGMMLWRVKCRARSRRFIAEKMEEILFLAFIIFTPYSRIIFLCRILAPRERARLFLLRSFYCPIDSRACVFSFLPLSVLFHLRTRWNKSRHCCEVLIKFQLGNVLDFFCYDFKILPQWAVVFFYFVQWWRPGLYRTVFWHFIFFCVRATASSPARHTWYTFSTLLFYNWAISVVTNRVFLCIITDNLLLQRRKYWFRKNTKCSYGTRKSSSITSKTWLWTQLEASMRIFYRLSNFGNKQSRTNLFVTVL